MASSSSSTKKAARLAQKGKGQKIRFQGGTMFPLIVALVVVLGLALVVYARQSRPAADASDPSVGDHWHVAYGFDICGEWFQLQGDAEARDANGSFINTDFARTGVHSHNDGVIHWHANSRAAVGRRAVFQVLLDVYDVELENKKLVFPEEQRGQIEAVFGDKYADGVFESGETTCTVDGEEVEGSLQMVVWDNFSDTDVGTTFVAAYGSVRVDRDAKVFSVAFVPDNTDVEMPPWAKDLPALGAIDSGQQLPDGQLFGGTTVPGEEVPTITAGENQTDAPATSDG
ncbi:hypothetical protein [Ilumatobacter sp.]|uniref:hypothetical protein n=1 Tax=Ilumatobacter sp. TaxID=1967498 RepID=UPI0030B5E872